jgi:hypothetical protein
LLRRGNQSAGSGAPPGPSVAAKLRVEMGPGDAARPILAGLAATDEAYIHFATDDPTRSGLDSPLLEMVACVSDVEDKDPLHLDFYGADRITRWANQHR